MFAYSGGTACRSTLWVPLLSGKGPENMLMLALHGFALIIDGEACFYGLPLQGAQGDEALERFGTLGVRQVAANRVKMGQSVNEAASMSVFQVADESTGEKLT